MSTPADQMQSQLAGAPQPDPTDNSQASDLGPDLYQGQAPPPPPSALMGAQGDQQAGNGLSFRQLWQQQHDQTQKETLQELRDHLKSANESIDSSYQKMMDQLGGQPQTNLSQKEKGMLLMEFGLRMMSHSRSQYGQVTPSVGAAIGESGTETLQSAKDLMAQKQAQAGRYAQMRNQLTIAQGKEKAQLASRSALEEGRDIRAFQQQDAMLGRTELQQQGAGARTESRNTAAQQRVDTQQAGANKRASMLAGQVKRTVTGDDGSIYGVTGSGSVVQLGKDGTPIKAAPGGGSGGGKQTAAQANYNLYMSTNGKDANGQPLTGQDLQNVQQEALKYAANPRTYQLSDAQRRQMAEKSADSFIRANPTSWMGMTPEEVQKHHDDYAESEYNRMQRGGPATPVPPAPRSALETPPNPGARPTASAVPRGTGAVPTQPPSGMTRGPNAAQLDALQKNPQQIAPYFLAKFGYLPREYQQFAQPQSALAR
ncbi:MAG TPA: hypothetical protein VLH80_07515 [Nitrospiraceae bacterium]|nr:hypothetical protein [Nitrospiraceae bacterium]